MKWMFLLLMLPLLTFAKDYESEGQKFVPENIIQREDVIWGFDFLPEGKIIFTERSGKMFVHDPASKKSVEVSGVPKVYAVGQGGLLDVRVHKDFAKNNRIYFTYSEPVGNLSTTAFAMAELKDNKLTNIKKIFSGDKPNDNDIHFGSRIEFDGKGHMFVTMGDRDDRPRVQDLKFNQGKVMRFMEDGSIPSDNPFLKVKDAKPEIYSLGIRSPQGLSLNPVTGEIWEAEMGPRGGDEINVIKAGANYGWPEVTYGREYYGPKIGKPSKEGMEESVIHWVPSISPSGMAFYTGDKFPKWKNNIFLGTLSGTHLRRIVLDGKKVVKEEKLLADKEWRFRNVRTGPDGFLYYSTDEGKLGRIKSI